jgi:hypothetical protein
MVVNGRLVQSAVLQPFAKFSFDFAANQFGHLSPAYHENAPRHQAKGRFVSFIEWLFGGL